MGLVTARAREPADEEIPPERAAEGSQRTSSAATTLPRRLTERPGERDRVVPRGRAPRSTATAQPHEGRRPHDGAASLEPQGDACLHRSATNGMRRPGSRFLAIDDHAPYNPGMGGRLLGLALAVSQAGCIETILTNGEIASTREAAASFDTLGDYELAKAATQAGLAQFEGMHRIAPSNTDALFMLVQGWGGYAWGFVEDEMEEAQLKGDEATAAYHKTRAKQAYDRAIFYGLELLSHNDKGFDKAKKNDATMNAWFKENFTSKDDAENLFWVAYAWMSRACFSRTTPRSSPTSTSAST